LILAIVTEQYERHKRAAAARQKTLSRGGRELYPLPGPASPERRRKALLSLQCYCEIYRKSTFSNPWSDDQLEFVHYLEEVIRWGGMKIQAMARGDGKTSIAHAGAEWGVLNGFRQFVVTIGATASKSAQNIASLRSTFEENDLLASDFPEVCYPIRWLKGITQARPLYLGDNVNIKLTERELQMPWIPGSPCAGSIFYGDGLLGKGLRGLKRSLPTGDIRPDLVIPDDPQDDESAVSPTQNAKRMRVIKGTVLGLAGPKRSISLVGAVTVIAQNDLAAQLLDRNQNPAFAGTRCQFLSKAPEGPLWDEYWRIRADCLRREEMQYIEATEFYKAHRAEMDAGIEERSPYRFTESEISATQYAANIIQDRGRAAFYAEFQNDPLAPGGDVQYLKLEDLRGKMNGLKRGVVPDWASVLVADIDVQDNILFWLVKAAGTDGARAIVDYGCYPDQNRRHFAVREVKRTLKTVLLQKKRKGDQVWGGDGADTAGTAFPDVSREEAMYDGLVELSNSLCGREWKRETGGTIPMRMVTIDAQDGDHWKIVYQVAREAPYKHLLMPRHGVPVKASDRPLSISAKADPAVTIGEEWVRGPCKKEYGRQERLLVDSNYWKSQSQARWLTGRGANGCATIFGRDFDEHGMFADHRTAEYPNRITAQGKHGTRVSDEWVLFPGRSENHFLDLDVATDVGLSVCGIRVLTESEPVNKPRRRISREMFYGQR